MSATEAQTEVQDELVSLLASREGHFLLESGHHGDLWLDLELLCFHPPRIRRFVVALADRLSSLDIEEVCGPLVEGAFVGMMVAAELDVEFTYSERVEEVGRGGMFPVKYQVARALREKVRGKRVAVVNDVINAGSAVRGTINALDACGAVTVGIGALLALGSAASKYAARRKVPLETVASVPNTLWLPSECPLCKSGVPLEDVAGFRERARF